MLADLLLHVVDALLDEDQMEVHMQAADSVLGEIGAGDKPRVLVLNKIDLSIRSSGPRTNNADAIFVSAVTGEGLERLKAEGYLTFERNDVAGRTVRAVFAGRQRDLHEVAGRIDREDEAEGVRGRADDRPPGASPL